MRPQSASISCDRALPTIGPRRLYHTTDGTRTYTEVELTPLPKASRANFVPETVDEQAYYYGPLGSPLFYMRLLDIVSANVRANLQGRRILEWNYSSIGPLKLLALQGLDAQGIEHAIAERFLAPAVLAPRAVA